MYKTNKTFNILSFFLLSPFYFSSLSSFSSFSTTTPSPRSSPSIALTSHWHDHPVQLTRVEVHDTSYPWMVKLLQTVPES